MLSSISLPMWTDTFFNLRNRASEIDFSPLREYAFATSLLESGHTVIFLFISVGSSGVVFFRCCCCRIFRAEKDLKK